MDTKNLTARRHFLRRLSGGAAVLGTPWWLAACGGGDGEPVPPAEGGGTPPLADSARRAAIAATEDHCRTLAQQPGLTPLAFAQAVAARMATQPAYARTGVDAETLSAWGRFTDGRVHVVCHAYAPPRRPEPAAPPAALVAAAAAVETPDQPVARLMQSFGPMFDGADVVTDLQGWMAKKGWKLPQGAEQLAPLSALRGLKGAGFFYINTHGGAGGHLLEDGSDEIMYSIQSSTLVTDATEAAPENVVDMAARRLTYFTASNGDLILGTFPDFDTRYGVTANFVDAYWKFAKDSVLLINACSSTRRSSARWAGGFIDACHRAGAGVYLGWNGTVTPTGAYRAARYLTDRLLGANEFEPEKPHQRPFPCDEVMADMQKKGYLVDPHERSVFEALPNPAAATPVQLAPSIRHVEVDEYLDELRLVGRFGTLPGEVSVGGSKRTIKRWEPGRVVVDLPRTGAGATGEVQVVVRGVKSNLRRITEWTIPLDYTYTVMEAMGLKIAGIGRIRLRADVGGTRDAPGQALQETVRYAYDTRDSELPLKASGAMPAGPCTVVWTGQATYRAIPEPGYRHGLMAYLKIDTWTRRGWLGLGLGTPGPDFVQTGCGYDQGIQPGFGTLDVPVDYPSPLQGSSDVIPLHAVAFDFDAQWRLQPDRSVTPLARVTWPVVAPVAPPLPTDGA